MSLTLASILTESARRYSNERAMILNGQTWTYNELLDQSLRLGAWLQDKGVRSGSHVALMCGNSPEFTVAYFAILAAGASVVSINTLLVADEARYQIEHSEACGIIVDANCLETVIDAIAWSEFHPWLLTTGTRDAIHSERHAPLDFLEETLAHAPLSRPLDANSDDTAVIMYTSGTTGKPKGAELSHFNLWENARILAAEAYTSAENESAQIGPGDVALATLPLFHSFGQTCIQNAMLFHGAAVCFQKRFDALQTALMIEKERASILAGVPTLFNALIHAHEIQPRQMCSLRFVISGGAPLPNDVRRAFEQKFSIPIQEGYGLTETSPVATVQRHWQTLKPCCIGRPVSGVELKIVDMRDNEVGIGIEGEIVIRGRNLMKGYLKQKEATAQIMRNGWFHTGDIGKQDCDGDFFIVDRQKDMIIRGGFNIYPREVEEVLYRHPDVLEASVFGIPDNHYGEEIKAVVSLRENSSATPEQLIAYCRERVAAYKYPRIIEIVDDIPKGHTGKILKREIRRLFSRPSRIVPASD